jgi:hypothetical protein
VPETEHLGDLKEVWGTSCHSMWAELLSISISETYLLANYKDLPSDKPLTSLFYIPVAKGRLDSLTKDMFLERANRYKDAVITNRVIILSAAFETYLTSFVDKFIAHRTKLFDKSTQSKTQAGNTLHGEIFKIRGLSRRIEKFAELAPSKIQSIRPFYSYIDDVYMMRNVLAHRAGLVDGHAATSFKHVSFAAGERVRLTTDKLLELAAPIIKIAEALDKKIH